MPQRSLGYFGHLNQFMVRLGVRELASIMPSCCIMKTEYDTSDLVIFNFAIFFAFNE